MNELEIRKVIREQIKSILAEATFVKATSVKPKSNKINKVVVNKFIKVMNKNIKKVNII